MIDISSWLDRFMRVLSATFGGRVWFVGLQGSYGRGEADENSDLDVVVILDELSAGDIRAYRQMLETLPDRERFCGFFSGRNELFLWEPSDLFQFYFDTKPILGSLDELLPLLNEEAVDRAIKIGACNIYHGCVHNMLHERSEELLRGFYKAASFVIRATVFRRIGRYVSRHDELLSVASTEEKGILDTFWSLKQGGAVEFDLMSEALFSWARGLLGA